VTHVTRRVPRELTTRRRIACDMLCT
jgi:hypothetical protein